MESKERIVYDPTEDRAKDKGKTERKATEKKPEKPTEKPQEQGPQEFKCSMNRYNFIHLGKKILQALNWPQGTNIHLTAVVEGGKVTFAIRSETG